MRRFHVPVFLALTACPVLLVAADKQPWLWTEEERVRARLDPELRAARVRQAQKERGAATAAAGVPADVIDGRTHPELFFPTQLFEKLVRTAFVTQPRIYPRVVAQQTSDLFRDPTEWARFAEISTEYARVLADEHRRLYGGDALTSDAAAEVTGQLRGAKCAAQARALRAARAAFGRERFDRFLYEVVAAGNSSTYISVETLEQSASALREREENCR